MNLFSACRPALGLQRVRDMKAAIALTLALTLPLIFPLPGAAAPVPVAANTTATAPIAPAQPPVRQISLADARADIALVRTALEEMHPGLLRYANAADMEAGWKRLESALVEGDRSSISELALYRELSRVLAAIRCDHTKAEYSQAMEAYRREAATHLPFRFRLFPEGPNGALRMFVVSADPAQPLPAGAEILKLNGRPVAELARTLADVMAIDGFTEPVRAHKLAQDSDLLGSGWDHYWPAFFGFAGQWQVDWQARPGQPLESRTLRPLTFSQWQSLPWPARYREDFHQGIHWRLAGKTAVLKINTFVNYRSPVDAPALLSAYFKVANQRGVEHLVVDLRDSGGGSNDAVLALLAHLIDAPVTWTRRQSVKALVAGPWVRHTERWDGRPGEYALPAADYERAADGLWDYRRGALSVAPAADQFKGRITLLTGPANNSGATMLIARLKDLGRVRLAGEATGGSAEGPTAGNLLTLRLPASGLRVRIPLVFSRMDVKSFEHGLGVRPDVEVRLTPEDVQRARDPVMEWLRDESRQASGRGG